ncbi:MAG: hypothetical protein ACJ70T_02015 [Nitrososphaera sp.]
MIKKIPNLRLLVQGVVERLSLAEDVNASRYCGYDIVVALEYGEKGSKNRNFRTIQQSV